MSEVAGKARMSAAAAVLAVSAAAALAGFLVGAVVGEDGVDVTQGLFYAVAYALMGLLVAAAAWWSTRRRAARFGLSASRYMRVGRQVQRGEVPENPEERPAAIDVATRQRRTLTVQRTRWVWCLMAVLALLWLVNAVIQFRDRNYGYACVNLALVGIFLLNPLAMRRQRRRLDTVERALHPRRPPHGTSDAC